MKNKFDDFVAAVRDSVEGHAKRKNYTSGGADDGNHLIDFENALGISEGHHIGEIIGKAAECVKAESHTKKIILEKIAGRCFILWRSLMENEARANLQKREEHQ